jgi:DivIVA domain-containing protein
MSNDAFHLTSHDVRAQVFQRVMRGYDPVQVDEFKQRLAEEIDRLVRERVQLDERVKGMSDQLKSYRDRERAMNDALVHAQQLRTDSQAQVDRERDLALREAQAEAEAIRLEARTESDRLLAETRGEQQRLLQANELARRQYVAYITSFRQLLERQVQELNLLGGENPEAAADDLQRGLRRQA